MIYVFNESQQLFTISSFLINTGTEGTEYRVRCFYRAMNSKSTMLWIEKYVQVLLTSNILSYSENIQMGKNIGEVQHTKGFIHSKTIFYFVSVEKLFF